MTVRKTEADTIKIVDFDKRWRSRYLRERRRLRSAFGSTAVRIEHIGSTAVRGLPAKPVVDIMIAVGELSDAGQHKSTMGRLGYTHVSHEDDSKRLFFYKGKPRMFHVHIVGEGSREYHDHIRFRDYLRASARARSEYAALKRKLAAKFTNDRESYVEGKNDFVEMILRKARKSDVRN